MTALTPRSHRAMIAPQPRAMSAMQHLAYIRQLETDGVLTKATARDARARVITIQEQNP